MNIPFEPIGIGIVSVGGALLGTGIIFLVVRGLLSLCEVALTDVGYMLMATHTDRQAEHIKLLRKLGVDQPQKELSTEQYPEALRDNRRYDYIKHIRGAVACAKSWGWSMIITATILLTIGLPFILAG